MQYYEGASAFGHSTARYDAAQAAAVMSQVVGKPVRLQFMRWDEHGWDFYGPTQMMDIQGGNRRERQHRRRSSTRVRDPGRLNARRYDERAGRRAAHRLTASAGGADTTNSGTQYNIPNRRVTSKSLPLFDDYLKTSSLAGPGARSACSPASR